MPDAQIRLKGNTAGSWIGDKLKFVLAFDNVDEDARVEGERKVALDAPFYEPTVLKDRRANGCLHRAGIAAVCTNNALPCINGELFRLYAHGEEMDRECLERNFGKDNADGYLWKYGVELQNHEGEAIDYTRITASWSDFDPAATTPMGDEERWLAAWAAEAVLADGDG